MTDQQTDVCIVGAGAAGSLAAMVLAQAGLRVTILEAGPHLDKRDFAPDELLHIVRVEMGNIKWNKELVTWRPDAHSPTISAPGWKSMNAVGGASVHYAAQSWRFHSYDFKLRSHTIERYGEAAIPEGSALADWPISYEELEPYYDKVEVAIGVAGKAGVLRDKTNGQPSIEEGGNPFEAPRSRRRQPFRGSPQQGVSASSAANAQAWHVVS